MKSQQSLRTKPEPPMLRPQSSGGLFSLNKLTIYLLIQASSPRECPSAKLTLKRISSQHNHLVYKYSLRTRHLGCTRGRHFPPWECPPTKLTLKQTLLYKYSLRTRHLGCTRSKSEALSCGSSQAWKRDFWLTFFSSLSSS